MQPMMAFLHPHLPPPGGDVDPFGIVKIYPTKEGGEEWYMNMDNAAVTQERAHPNDLKSARL